MDGFQRHFDSQLLIYGKQTILNLVSRPPFLSHLLVNGSTQETSLTSLSSSCSGESEGLREATGAGL